MKKIIGGMSLLVLFACNPNAQLEVENVELKRQVEALKKEAHQQKELAIAAAAAAQQQADLAKTMQDEAVKRVEVLEKQLKNCK